MCDTKSYSSHKNLSFQTFLDCYQILTVLRLFLGRFNLSQADRPRLHSGHIIGVTEAYRCIWRTVSGSLADYPRYNFLLIRASGEKLHEGRTVRLLPADRPLYKISDSPEFCQLSQFQL